MNSKAFLIGTMILMGMFTLGCHLIFEDDIEGKELAINSPVDGYVTTQSSIHFWWEELEGADYYKLEVYALDNGQVSTLFVDSNVSGNQFEWSFAPGTYEWNLQAWNSAYSSKISFQGFSIDSSLNLSSTKIVQVSPAADAYTNAHKIAFNWLKVYNADRYFVQVKDLNGIPFGNEMETDTHYLSIPNSISTDTLDEGGYIWSIRAENSYSVSLTSSQEFNIDRTAPEESTALIPQDNTTQNDTMIHFSWASGSDDNWLLDSILIYNDSLTQNLRKGKELQVPNYQDSLGPGTYYWYIKTLDKAGNFSESPIHKLHIQ